MTTTALDREQTYRLKPPGTLCRVLELRAPFESLLLAPTAPWLLTMPRGDGRQVMFVPGFLADDGSTWPLRRYLDYLGYRTLPWDHGRNRGQPEKDARRLLDSLKSRKDIESGITLIGWSLGGVIVREVARLAPELVTEVITYGTPVEGGPKYTSTAAVYAKRRKLDLDAFEQYIHSINQRGITQPLTVIYSKTDGVVGWQAAIDRYNPQATHIHIPGSHIGMGTNPLVWRAIAKTLFKSRNR